MIVAMEDADQISRANAANKAEVWKGLKKYWPHPLMSLAIATWNKFLLFLRMRGSSKPNNVRFT